MKTELYSVSKIFTERILRIPDYQRGYAWTEKHLKDFWNDLIQLENKKSHYTGVLTFEEVPDHVVESWREDHWIVRAKGYAPYYIVDGQQRLTTTILLIQAITESVNESDRLNYTTIPEIRKKFIFESKDDGISRSYLFGYEKDNPSYEFLKTHILGERSDNSFPLQETIYTHNLDYAKQYFVGKVKELTKDELEFVYRKLTQHFVFNIYSIATDIDVCVAFETMNNRGKPLSHLELLKNRLIYLSTKFEAPDYEKRQLRHAINESWKSVYHYLGKNKDNPLDDDIFLSTHFVLYIGGGVNTEAYSKELRYYQRYAHRLAPRAFMGNRYKDYLLERKFTTKNLPLSGAPLSPESLTIQEIYAYVQSLKESVEIWYALMNPQDSSLSEDEKEWMLKLNRLGFADTAPLILIFFQREQSKKLRLRLLKAIERELFVSTLVGYPLALAEAGTANMLQLAGQLSKEEITPEKLVRELDQRGDSFVLDPRVAEQMRVDRRDNGFYAWHGIRYFLFEYEMHLKSKSKAYRDKLEWEVLSGNRVEFGEDRRDYITVEHIYPQRPKKPCWTDGFRHFSNKQRSALRHSLGNLVPLSKPKNSSFQNQCFADKISKPGSQVGFLYGSYSENEVAANKQWTAAEILDRGVKLLDFMEQRWKLSIGGYTNKVSMLGLEFLVEEATPVTVSPSQSSAAAGGRAE